VKTVAFKTLSSDSDTDPGIVAEINITPLTDIFLVLLIIFMVTSSVMSQMGVDVNLPAASNQTSQSQPEGIIVTLMTGGKMKINEQEVPNNDMGAFENGLRSAFSKTKSRLVILEGDRQAFLGSAIQVMDSARKAGAEKFAIATSPENGK
jgi:biopolymer transport protein ExbD